ncbi:MAG: hypothetical protein ACTSYL_10780, partial [Candidatus Thorarchaeota archaeon]
MSSRIGVSAKVFIGRTVSYSRQILDFLRTAEGLVFIAACISTLLTSLHYLITLANWSTIGFSLDDSWIHLQYARTIYEGIPWEYSPGHPSTGSTSPLWSIILVPLFYLAGDVDGLIIGVYTISIFFYILCTFIVGLLILRHTERGIYSILGMIAFVITPKTTWLMLSGMEFPVFLFLLLGSIFVYERSQTGDRYIVGALLGLSYLARPEGILLVGIGFLIWAVYLTGHESYRQVLKTVSLTVIIAGLIALPWIIHCLTVTGLPLPDTFYAKVHQNGPAEIAVWNGWWTYWLASWPFLLIGIFLGLILVKQAKPYLWVYPVVLTLVYRLVLPYLALINNSRYLVPIFAMLMVCAVICVAKVFDRV